MRVSFKELVKFVQKKIITVIKIFNNFQNSKMFLFVISAYHDFVDGFKSELDFWIYHCFKSGVHLEIRSAKDFFLQFMLARNTEIGCEMFRPLPRYVDKLA